MKKEKVLVLFAIMIGIIIVQFASASVERVCSDGKNVTWSQKELKQGSTKIIGMINIALIGADESAAFGRAGVSLIIDARKISLINKSATSIEINEVKYSVSLVNSTEKLATISFNGQTKTILLDEFEMMGSFAVYLDNSEGNGDNLVAADLIIGSSQFYLTSGEDPYQKIKIVNTTYVIELISASDDDAVIRVSSCQYADIWEIKEYKKVIKEREANNSQNASGSVTNLVNTTLIKRQIGEGCKKNEECLSDYCAKEKCTEATMVQKIINWFKKTFSWK